MERKYRVNREYKDRLFKILFSKECYREDLLKLYNALNGSEYTNVEDMEINTLEDTVYMGMKNDISFLFGSLLSLYEQQSTFTPNMPLREFLYSAELYQKWLDDKRQALYGKRLVKIPAPRCYVFYNGDEQKPDRLELKLSDAFEVASEGYEWTSIMLNINAGHNLELMQKCDALRDYSMFIQAIKELQRAGENIVDAVENAVALFEEGHGSLAKVLHENRAEVVNVILNEYDEKKTMEYLREEALEEGIEKGLEKGLEKGREETFIESIKNVMASLNLDVERAMEILKVPEDLKVKYKCEITKRV